MNVLILAIAICISFKSFATLTSQGVFFEELESSNSNVVGDRTLASLTDAPFHYCYSNSDCNYVIKDTRTGKFSIKEKEDNLPAEKQFLRIWKKVKPGMFTKGLSSIFISLNWC